MLVSIKNENQVLHVTNSPPELLFVSVQRLRLTVV